MRNIVFTGLGVGFILMGAGLYALTLRKGTKPDPANPNKSQLRERAVLAEENKKMRIAAGCVAGLGAFLVLFAQL